MGAKASLHMSPMKSMDAALSDENERRDKSREWFDRGENSKGVPYHYDWWRRLQNFEIVKGKIVPQLSQEIPLHERLKNRLHELGFKNYKTDASNMPNVCMDFVIGGTREKMRDMAFKNQEVNYDASDPQNAHVMRHKEIEDWALDTYRWAAAKYGEDNIIGFNVHLDETTPHIHMQVVPVGEVKKRGRVKPGEERGTKKTVSYAAVVGKTPEDLSHYLDNLHTDYHLQVGYKYGLERGTFFDDLTPEEQAQRKHRTKGEYVEWLKSQEKNAALKDENATLQEKNESLDADIKLAEKKLKGLTTMISNLEEKRADIKLDIAGLEELVKNGKGDIESNTRKLEELKNQVSALDAKLLDKRQKLRATEEQLRELDDTKMQTAQTIKEMADSAIRRQDIINARLKEAENAIKEKRAEVAKMDKFGEIQRAQNHADKREAVLYRLWPEARDAVKAIFHLGDSNTATDFTPQQALFVEHALVTSGTTRTKAAEELMSLARRDFDTKRTFSGRVDAAGRVLMSIANGTHQRLTALLKQQPKDAGGGPSYITDLTDWAGNQIHR